MILPIIQPNELISLYILKSYLKSFKHTSIESNLINVIEKIEIQAPGDILIEYDDGNRLQKDYVWDQENGEFNYKQYDVIITSALEYIYQKRWTKIIYQSLTDNKTRSHIVLPEHLFVYHSILYIVVFFPKYKDHLALAVHRIRSIKGTKGNDICIPQFDINEFRMKRFGVFYGTIEHVKLLVNPEYVKWFTDRIWHPSQIIHSQKNGSIIIEMDVPLSPDFISWILGWHEGIIVKEPDILIHIVSNKIRKMLDMYKE